MYQTSSDGLARRLLSEPGRSPRATEVLDAADVLARPAVRPAGVPRRREASRSRLTRREEESGTPVCPGVAVGGILERFG